jgi:hypothetical protein
MSCLPVSLIIFTWRSNKRKKLYSTKYVAVSKCSRNYFISDKYERAPLFKLYFLQNSPLLQLRTSASDCKGAENIPGSRFVKAVSALPSHS